MALPLLDVAMDNAMTVGVFEAFGEINGPGDEGGWYDAAAVGADPGKARTADQELESQERFPIDFNHFEDRGYVRMT